MTFDDLTFLGPLFDATTRLGAIIAVVVVALRLINWTIRETLVSWKQSVDILRGSADYARAETEELRERVDHLEDEARQLHQERFAWLAERAQMAARIDSLERTVTLLTAELDELRQPD